MNSNILKLAVMFLVDIKGFGYDINKKIDCNVNYKSSVIEDISEILDGKSLTATQFYGVLDKAKSVEDKHLFHKPSEVLEYFKINYKRGLKRDPNNLIQLNRFYYHPKLQVAPPPPVLKIEDDGTITPSYDSEDFYLEMKDSFTVEDLLDYFYSKKNMAVPDSNIKKDIGAFNHLLQFWDIDFLMFLIDEAFTSSVDEGKPLPNSPLDIQEYDAQAMTVYEARKNICHEEGLDHVIPRG